MRKVIKPMSDDELSRWPESGDEDDIHIHFEGAGQWFWVDIRNEWLRLNKLMFGKNMEGGDEDILACGAIAQASNGALSAVSAALGVSRDALTLAIEDWLCKGDGEPLPPVGFDGLKIRCQEAEKWMEDLRSYRRGKDDKCDHPQLHFSNTTSAAQ